MNPRNPIEQTRESHDVIAALFLQPRLIVFYGAPFVRVDILTQQRNFPVSTLEQIFSFGYDGFRIAASLTPAREGNHAERAHVVTSAHDGNERRYPVRVQAYRTDVSIGLFPRQEGVYCLLAVIDLGNQAG